MTPVLRLLMVYAASIAFGGLVYIALFQLAIQGIVFYRGLVLAAGAAVIVMAGLVIVRQRVEISLDTIVGATGLSFAFNLCLLVVFIVTIDRSISVYLLSRLDDRPMTTAALRDQFVNEYVHSMAQIARRVEEQQASGNVMIDRQGVIHLTTQGQGFLHEARLGTRLFRTDPRFTAAVPQKTATQ